MYCALSVTVSSATNGSRGTNQALTVSDGGLSTSLSVCIANLLVTAFSGTDGFHATNQAQTISNASLSSAALSVLCVCIGHKFFSYQWLSRNQPGTNSGEKCRATTWKRRKCGRTFSIFQNFLRIVSSSLSIPSMPTQPQRTARSFMCASLYKQRLNFW